MRRFCANIHTMEMGSEERSGSKLTGTWIVVLSILAAIASVVALVMVAACNGDVDTESSVSDDSASQPKETVKRDAPPLPKAGFEGFEQWDSRIAAYENLLTQGESEQSAIVDIFGPEAEKPEGAEYLFRYSIFDCNNIWVLVDFTDDFDYERNVQIIKDFLADGAAPWPENNDPEWQITQEHGRVRVAIPITLLRSLYTHPEVEGIYFPLPTDFAIPI